MTFFRVFNLYSRKEEKIRQIPTPMDALEKARHALGQVQDPDLGKDLVTLNMIKDLEVSARKVSFTLVLTTPACPMKEALIAQCQKVLQEALGDIEISIQASAQVLPPPQGAVLEGVKNIIGVASGKGGVGKSTLSANLAIALHRLGARVGVLDADIFGPSMPTLFHCAQEKPEVRQEEGKHKLLPVEQYGIRLMSMGFLTAADQAVVWRGPMASSALRQLLHDTLWGDLDYLLVDLPPGTSDIPLTLVQALPITGVVVVTTPQKIALCDVHKSISMFMQPQIRVKILGIVENMSYFSPSDMPSKRYHIFGQGGGEALSKQYDLPFLGEIPLVEAIREGSDVGYPITMENNNTSEAYTVVAQKMAQQISIHRAQQQKESTQAQTLTAS